MIEAVLGIIAATQIEAKLIVRQLKEKDDLSIQKKAFYKGILQDTPVVVCICGIGKTNAAHGITLLLEKFKPDFVYMIGVAGAYPSSGLNIGDIAIAEKEVYGDEGLLFNGECEIQNAKLIEREDNSQLLNFQTMDKLDLPLATINGKNYFNTFPMFIPKKFKSFKNKGGFVTVSTCTGTLKRGKELEKAFNAICENMEGAAIAHICMLSGVSATEIRGISNIIGNRAANQLDKSDIILASENVQEFLYKAITSSLFTTASTNK